MTSASALGSSPARAPPGAAGAGAGVGAGAGAGAGSGASAGAARRAHRRGRVVTIAASRDGARAPGGRLPLPLRACRLGARARGRTRRAGRPGSGGGGARSRRRGRATPAPGSGRRRLLLPSRDFCGPASARERELVVKSSGRRRDTEVSRPSTWHTRCPWRSSPAKSAGGGRSAAAGDDCRAQDPPENPPESPFPPLPARAADHNNSLAWVQGSAMQLVLLAFPRGRGNRGGRHLSTYPRQVRATHPNANPPVAPRAASPGGARG